MLICSLTKGITPKMCRLCFVPINSVLLNLSCDRHDNQTFLFILVGSVREQECGCKRHDNQTFPFIIVGCVEIRNGDAKDMTINPTFLFILVGLSLIHI